MTRAGAILLINPDWRGIRKQKQPQFKRIWQPLDLATAAAILERNGFSVQILDNNIKRLSPQEIGRLSADFDKIFVTSTPYDRWQCPSLDISFFFRTVEHIPPKRLYLMGAHVTERPGIILEATGARLAILGEPEQTILDLVRRDLLPEIPPDIPGIAYFKDGRFIRSPPRGYISDLDQLPYPAYHLLDMERYYYEFLGTDFAIIEGSRGCPHRCSFCYLGMYGNRFRQKSLERLLNEVAYLKDQFRTQNIYFMDLEFALNRPFILSFCKALVKNDVGINWCCQTRVTDVDKDLLKWMKKAGCSLIHFGVEAGSSRILNQTGKGIKVSDCVKAISMTHENGIRTALFMNFGFPGETRAEMESTIDLSIRLNPTYASFHLIVPFPGTRLAEEVNLDPEALPAHLYPHYNDVHHDLKSLKSVLRRAYLRFYLRPSYIISFLRELIRQRANHGRLFVRLLHRSLNS
ncbi:MAG: radical SAM protein [Pseudomonadota bacterium]